MKYVVHIYIRFDELTVKVDFLLVYYEHKASEYQVFQWFEFSLPLLWLVNSKFLRNNFSRILNWPIREEIGKSSKFNKSSNLKIWRIFGSKRSTILWFITRIYYWKKILDFNLTNQPLAMQHYSFCRHNEQRMPPEVYKQLKFLSLE